MKIRFHRKFEKQYKKTKKREQTRAKERLALFLKDEYNLILNNHPLRGKYKGYRSINITGNLRAVYRQKQPNEKLFVAIDTHSNLYR